MYRSNITAHVKEFHGTFNMMFLDIWIISDQILKHQKKIVKNTYM